MIELLQSYWSILFPLMIIVFLGFVFLMKVKYRLDGDFKNSPWYAVPFIVVIGLFFLVFDWLLNIVGTILYLDLPASLFELTTGRMTRYKEIINYTTGGLSYKDLSRMNKFRFKSGFKICKILEELDPGHCSE